MKTKNNLLVLLLLFGAILSPTKGATPTNNTGMELPKLTSKNAQQIIRHYAFTISFNSQWNIPNWVAYTLTKEETTGEAERKSSFYPDPNIKNNPVVTKDYSNSGYDRGHMAPAADMKWSERAMKESFYTTNICPQNQNLNRGDWNDLEELARDLAKQYGAIHIACGPIVENTYKTIGSERKIVVPSAFYKVFLRQKSNGEWTAIGFVMPNESGSRMLMTYMKSIDEIEKLTQIDFFYNLPDEIENEIENDFSIIDWVVK